VERSSQGPLPISLRLPGPPAIGTSKVKHGRSKIPGHRVENAVNLYQVDLEPSWMEDLISNMKAPYEREPGLGLEKDDP
jgi:hypothetical protein